MCTVMVLRDRFVDAPLVVAANRDERYDRPAEGPSLRLAGGVRCLAPRDSTAGGTWWAIGARGWFVALTNRFGVPNDPARESRGRLVERLTGCGGFDAAIARAGSLDGRKLNGFHLVLVEGERQAVFVGDGEQVRRVPAEGSLFVSERSYGADDLPRDDRTRALLTGLGPRFDAAALGRVLASHGEGFLGPCIHADPIGYGTRSSMVWAPALGALRTTDGPPCTHPVEVLDTALATLDAA